MQLKTFLSKLKERKKSNLITNASDVGLLKSDCQTSMKVLTLLHVVTLFFCCLYFLSTEILVVFKDWMFPLYVATIAIIVVHDRKINKKDFFDLVLFTSFCFFTTYYTNGGLGSIPTLVFPLVLICLVEYSYVNRVFLFILKLNSIFVLSAFVLISSIYLKDYSSYYLKFSYLNPNTIADIALASFIMYGIVIDNKNFKDKILFLFLALVTFYIISRTKCRTALLGLVVFCFLSFFSSRIFKKFFAKKYVPMALLAVGLVVPIIYCGLHNIQINIVFFGKNLYTGREGVWGLLFEQLNAGGVFNWLFGVGSDAVIFHGDFDAHNSYYSVIGCFGLFGLMLYILFFARKIKLLYNFTSDSVVRKSLITFYVFLIMSWVETINVLSFISFSFFLPIGLGLSRARELNSKKNMCADISIVSL